MEMSNDRQYLNVLKGLLIVLVVIGHFGQTVSNLAPSNIMFIGHGFILFIYVFHMPLFLFVSGYLSKNCEKRRDAAFKDLFIPYLLYQVFVEVCMLILTNRGGVMNLFVPQMGIWYLLSLFSMRILLPEIKKIKHIVLVGICLTIFICMFDGMNNAFAIQKTLGFFVFFIVGYFVSEDTLSRIRNVIPRKIAVLCLGIELAAIVIFAKFADYNLWLSVLSRTATILNYSKWYFAPISYAIVFLITCITCVLVINAIPTKNRFLERQGKDTMPMYISHLIVFMALSFVVNKDNRLFAMYISLVSIVICLFLFSTDIYRRLFNNALGHINNFLLKKE